MAAREKEVADEAKRKLEDAEQKLKEEKEELKLVLMEKDEQSKALLADKVRVEQLAEKAKQVARLLKVAMEKPCQLRRGGEYK